MPFTFKVLRPRIWERPLRRRWQPTRPTLAFAHTGDVTVVLTVGSIPATSVSGASTGGVYVRPVPAGRTYVGVG